jgi:hypothetical protein
MAIFLSPAVTIRFSYLSGTARRLPIGVGKTWDNWVISDTLSSSADWGVFLWIAHVVDLVCFHGIKA